MNFELHISKFIYSIKFFIYITGKVVAGYKVTQDVQGQDTWTLLGKRDPLTPQMFYPVENKDPIRQGDILAARCTMKSDKDTTTYIGYVFGSS